MLHFMLELIAYVKRERRSVYACGAVCLSEQANLKLQAKEFDSGIFAF